MFLKIASNVVDNEKNAYDQNTNVTIKIAKIEFMVLQTNRWIKNFII